MTFCSAKLKIIMAKIGRNSPCPCGSGKKYKRCCQQKELEMTQQEFPSGRFRYESGSYGGPGRSYFPSIICYKESEHGSWSNHFCLVKPDTKTVDDDTASSIAKKDLAVARSSYDENESPHDFAMSLRHEGYKNMPDFHVVSGN